MSGYLGGRVFRIEWVDGCAWLCVRQFIDHFNQSFILNVLNRDRGKRGDISKLERDGRTDGRTDRERERERERERMIF